MTRKAQYTCKDQDEVQLDFIKDCGPDHADTGKPGVVFYPRELYQLRQQQHGAEVYPDPEAFSE